MDPIANLTAQRSLALSIVGNPSRDVQANELAELVLALDEWRTTGGFDPYTVKAI